MPLDSGTTLGLYEIQSPLGAGGMGEVYKARDTRLDRTVAIKVLPAHVAGDPDLKQRFEREARAVAALNHPHICTLHDIGQEGDTDFLVLEHLDGETLAERLQHGALPLDHALAIAIQIADALDRAHGQGIVHRDLKPGNIMLIAAGAARGGAPQAKLLDFGLAKLKPASADPAGGTALPTQGATLTQAGTILGTFQYMAPEQLEGGEADARTDIFAFGTVVYEMVTGQKAFEGKSQASLIGAILKDDPPTVAALQPLTPAALGHIVSTCLAKNPDARWSTAGDVLRALRSVGEPGTGSGQRVPTAVAGDGTERFPLGVAAAAVLATAVVAVAGTLLLRPPVEDAPQVVRFSIPAVTAPGQRAFAVSPDGHQLAVSVPDDSGRVMLGLRSIDDLSVVSLAGTEGGTDPFWSPDGRFLGFFADRSLKVVSASGGRPRIVCEVPPGAVGTWAADGTILYSTTGAIGPLMRVAATGGEPVSLGQPGGAGTIDYWPHFLPDGRHYLYLNIDLTPGSTPDETNGVMLGSLDSDERRLLFRASSRPVYHEAGYLLFVRGGALLAQPFDAEALEPHGEAVAVADGIQYALPNGRADFDAGGNALVYNERNAAVSELVWRDRAGIEVGQLTMPGAVQTFRLSPDGQRIAVAVTDPSLGTGDLWIYDVTRDLPTRLTFDPATEAWPVWSSDGASLLFGSDRAGPPDVYRMRVDGGEAELLLEADGVLFPEDWSADGREMLISSAGDLLTLAGDGSEAPVGLLTSPFAEFSPRFSPDGGRVAYMSDESGSMEVYVQRFPGPGDKQRVSRSGGALPVWRADGSELFYRGRDGTLFAAPVASDPFDVGEPILLFDDAAGAFDVAPDGQRFLMRASSEEAATDELLVVLNWSEELKNQDPVN